MVNIDTLTLAPVVTLTDDELADAVMPWAREQHPDKAQQVQEKCDDRVTYRRWLGRLLELRWADDSAWRTTAPMMALHETALAVQFRHRTAGLTFTVNGRYAPRPWVWTFAELAGLTVTAQALESHEDFLVLLFAKHHLDLEHYG